MLRLLSQSMNQASLLVKTLFRVRAAKPGKVIELDRQQMLTLIQTDAELGETLMRAFILRRVELIAAGVGDVILIGSTHSASRIAVLVFSLAQALLHTDI